MPLSRINTNAIANNAVVAADLANTGVTAGTYGGSSNISVVTVNAQGLVTSASNSAINLNSVTGDLTVSGNTTINGTGFLKIPSGTTAERPTSNAAGYIRYNTSFGYPEWYDSTNGIWTTFKLTAAIYPITYLVIAGGGGGKSGSNAGGGGGAGGVLSGTVQATALTSYTVTVGTGGTGSPASPGNAPSGGTSSIGAPLSISATGGGGGGGAGAPGAPGGSGGGGGSAPNNVRYPGGSGTPGQGFAGGAGLHNPGVQ